MKKIIILVGTRPNYIKSFPVYKKLITIYDVYIVHSGQHYDKNMNDIFFSELGIPNPTIQFELKSKSESGQLGEIIVNLTEYFKSNRPNLLLVFGDVTTTLAGALVANKMKIKLAHIESGLRSFDKSMPEEINRILVDNLSDLHFVTEYSGILNLEKENINNNYLVGNTMIDTLIDNLNKIKKRQICDEYNLSTKNYIAVTLHRQSNVDNKDKLEEIFRVLNNIDYKFIIPMHPRTKHNIMKHNIDVSNIIIIEPLSYINFLSLVNDSLLIITDSGGVQEETTYLNIPCLTIRENTERPSTLIINGGTNKLIDVNDLHKEIINVINNPLNIINNNNLLDGNASDRIVTIIQKYL